MSLTRLCAPEHRQLSRSVSTRTEAIMTFENFVFSSKSVITEMWCLSHTHTVITSGNVVFSLEFVVSFVHKQ